MDKQIKDKLRYVRLDEINIENACFHYTNKNNLDSISEGGLLPKIGINSDTIELNPKIFFTIGGIGILEIMDVWINWLICRPKNQKLYKTGFFMMKSKYVPNFLINVIWKKWFSSKKRLQKKCGELNAILKDSVFLVLDIEENIDYYNGDVDEVKVQGISDKFIKKLYKTSHEHKMEFWNMHTIVNHKINSKKLKVLSINNEISGDIILSYFIENNIDYVKKHCKNLFEYSRYI